MLRITKLSESASQVTLQLQGKIVSDWVSLVECECRRWLQCKHTVRLDVSEVTFIDRCGVEMLKRLASGHLHLINSSVLVQTLL